MIDIILEEHLFFGRDNSCIKAFNDLKRKGITHLSVYDTKQNILCEGVINLKANKLTEEQYALFLAKQYFRLDDSKSFRYISCNFILSGNIKVECQVYRDRVSIMSSFNNKVKYMDMSYDGIKKLRTYICTEFCTYLLNKAV